MNITLIGMPGVGKTLIGKELAKKLDYNFIDVDEIMEKNSGFKLQRIIDLFGEDEFLKTEEKTVLELGELNNSVISPGGSVVYCEKAMRFLKRTSKVVYLDASFETINSRIDPLARGVIGMKKGLKSVYMERFPLYHIYADITIRVPDKIDAMEIVAEIIKIIGSGR